MFSRRPTQDRTAQDAAARRPLLSRGAWTLLLAAVVVLFVLWVALLATPNTKPLEVPGIILLFFWSLLTNPGAFSAVGVVLIIPGTFFLLLLALIATALRTKARQRALAVVGYVAAAVRLRVPLPTYLRAAASSESLAMGRRLRRAAAMLDRGVALGPALRVTAGELPPLMLDRIAAAEQAVAPGDMLSDTIDHQRMRYVTRDVANPVPAYAIVTACLIVMVSSMLMVFIIPKYAQIFADFHLRLPPVTQALIDLSRGVALSIESYTLFILSVMLLGAILQSRSIARSTMGSPGSDVPLWLRRAMGRAVWFLPVVGPIVRDRQTAVTCEALGEALRAGRPMPESIGLATLPSLNGVLRERMAAWRTRVEAGEPTASAARAARLPGLLGDVLAGPAVQEGDNAAGAIEFAGRTYAARAVRASAAVSAVVPIATTLVLAAGVAFVALAMFTPIVKLIDSIAG